MKKLLACLAISILAISTIAACSSSSSTSSKQENVTLKLAHVLPESETQAQGAKKFAEDVEKTTNGKIKIQLFSGGTLGKDTDLLNSLKVNTVDIWLGGAGVLSGASETAKIFTMPFMFDNQQHFEKVYNGEVGKDISGKIEKESGYKVISYWTRGARWLTTNKEVKTVGDLKGLKIRVPESPVFVKSFSRMGASPTPMEFGQVFTSLQQKVIDGQENPLSLIFNSRFNEVNKYLIKTEHVREPIAVAMSSSKFNSLSPELQKALLEAINGQSKQYVADEVKKGDESYLKQLQESGMKLIEPDITSFQSKLDGFVDMEFPNLKEIYGKVREVK